MEKEMEFAVPFAGVLLLMFLYADFLVQFVWVIAWLAIKYKYVKSDVAQN
jgi:hypothetical protein